MENKKILMSIIAVLVLIVITIGISLAFFNYAKIGTTDNTIETGSITFLYTETSTVGRGIAIEDAFPISNEEGKLLTGEGNVFDFSIKSSTALDIATIPYEVTARMSGDSNLNTSLVKIYLTEVNGTNETELLLDNYSLLEQTSRFSEDVYTEKVIYTDVVPNNSSDYNKSFRLRIWIDDSGLFSNEDMNKKFTITVNVYANAEVNESSRIKVNATNSNGENLNAIALEITGNKKEQLLSSLEDTWYIDSKDDVDVLIEVKSDDFEDIATTTFDVSNIAEVGDTVVILHFNETTNKWEYIGKDVVKEDGTVTGDFTSYSPVAFVVLKPDGTIENIERSLNVIENGILNMNDIFMVSDTILQSGANSITYPTELSFLNNSDYIGNIPMLGLTAAGVYTGGDYNTSFVPYFRFYLTFAEKYYGATLTLDYKFRSSARFTQPTMYLKDSINTVFSSNKLYEVLTGTYTTTITENTKLEFYGSCNDGSNSSWGPSVWGGITNMFIE